MMVGALMRLGYFFRPFRRGAYRHAPSIEELYVIRQRGSSRMRASWRQWLARLLKTPQR